MSDSERDFRQSGCEALNAKRIVAVLDGALVSCMHIPGAQSALGCRAVFLGIFHPLPSLDPDLWVVFLVVCPVATVA